jgi:AraC-like DNA-binding protein
LLADPACRHSIAAVAWLCGFEDPSAFSRGFRRRFGCQPRDVRRIARMEHASRH